MAEEAAGSDEEDEARDDIEVASPEAFGFLKEAVEPFEAVVLQPSGGLLHAACVEVEGGADADHEGGLEPGEVFGHEAFLLGGAEADPEDVGAGFGDLFLELLGFFGGEGAEGGAVGAGDLEAGVAGGEGVAEFFGDAWGSAVEEVADGEGAGGFHDGEHEVGAVDAGHVFVAGEAAHPDGGHAVGGAEEGVVEDVAEGGVGAGFDNAVDAGDADVAAALLGGRFDDAADGVGDVEDAHLDAEEVVGGGWDGGERHFFRKSGKPGAAARQPGNRS